MLVKPEKRVQGDPSALAEYENMRHGPPSREANRSDYFLQGPPGGGSGDGGAV